MPVRVKKTRQNKNPASDLSKLRIRSALQLKIAVASVAVASESRRNSVMLVRSLTRKHGKSPHDYGV
ncbi:hypothetical protein ABH992_000831 [Bradyrhizobium yuanmingense]|uniref:50S ribosomal protein L22 n=1 Tax=Bradyrhizobium yuanmingense TaxID=108015 RepID=A0ABV4G956_9BRAD